MLSVVSVFNDAAKLDTRLKSSLARQNVPYQLIAVDNRDGRFPGASAALNYGASQAEGSWIIFVHQDIELIEHDWLERAEHYLSKVDPDGWHGLLGRTHAGRWRGLIRDRDMVFGEPYDAPVEVMTLDEIVLIHRNRGAGHPYFDEGLAGWHAYGVDACCRAIRAGARNSILPLPVWHDSRSTNLAKLREAHAYVWTKHRSAFSRIYTTCGVLPHAYGWSGSYKIASLFQTIRHQQYRSWLRSGEGFEREPWEVLEEMTRDEPEVHVYHRPFRLSVMEGAGFTDRTTNARPIIHHFTGLPTADDHDCVVIAPDLANELFKSNVTFETARRLIVATYLDDAQSLDRWRQRIAQPFECRLAMEKDETRWGIMEFALTPLAASRG